MKRVFPLMLAICIVIFSSRCQKELSAEHGAPGVSNHQSSPIQATLQGNIILPSGLPAAGVIISVGSSSTTTDSRGYFRIADAMLDQNASLIKAEYPGYFDAFRSFRATSGANQVVIKLTAKELLASLTSAAGGTVVMSNGAKLILPAGAVQKLNGDPYAGDIKVYAAYIDPRSRDIGLTVPGSFMADNSNNDRGVLTSFGMLAVELRGSTGELLKIMTGKTAGLVIPIPANSLASAPATISLWYLDELSGIWKEEGTAQKSGSNYEGSVKHFSCWNADFYLPAVSFTATFKSSDGALLTNLPVIVRSAEDSGVGYAHGWTDSLGQVSGLVPANKPMLLQVIDQCYVQAYSNPFGPFATNTDLGTVVVAATSPSLVTLKGTLVSCNNKPVANGFAMIYWENFRSIVQGDGQGRFSTTVLSCSGRPQTFDIIGVDTATRQQGALQTIAVNRPVSDAGTIKACGIFTSTFITYNVDGTDHSFSELTNDSLLAETSDEGVSPFTYLSGINSSGDWLTLNFNCNRQPGVFPVNSMTLAPYQQLGLLKPFTVSITSWPMQHGEFFEGSFAGNFVDSTAIQIIHSINGTFRIRR